MKLELGDHSFVRCQKTGLVADIEFKTKGFISGTYNAISGKIKREGNGNGDVLYEITGKWNEEMWIKNIKTGDKELLFNAEGAKYTPPKVRPLEEQEERESRRLWSKVTSAIIKRDQNTATEAKSAIEDRQREETRTRDADGVSWRPRFFKQVDESFYILNHKMYVLALSTSFLLTNSDTTLPPNEIKAKIESIARISPLSEGPSPSETDPASPVIPPHRSSSMAASKSSQKPESVRSLEDDEDEFVDALDQ